MRLQSGQSTCGQTCAANALRALGKSVTEDQVANRLRRLALDGDPANNFGTTDTQIRRLLESYRVPVRQMEAHEAALGVAALRGELTTGRVVCLAVDNNAHWVLAFGVTGSGFQVADSADSEIVVTYTEGQLAARWGASGNPKSYYGLVAGRGVR